MYEVQYIYIYISLVGTQHFCMILIKLPQNTQVGVFYRSYICLLGLLSVWQSFDGKKNRCQNDCYIFVQNEQIIRGTSQLFDIFNYNQNLVRFSIK